MCRFANTFNKRDAVDNPCQGRIQTRRRIACLPTIFEVVNEEKGTRLSNTDESGLPLVQGFEYERESKEKEGGEKHDHAEGVMWKTTSRRMALSMNIDAAKRPFSQRNIEMRTAYPDFFPGYSEKTCCCANSSIQSIRVYHQNACFGLKSLKIGRKEDVFEKQKGIAAWLKFFG